MKPAAQQVVDRLVQRLADDVPASHLDGAQGGSIGQARVPVVVARGVHALPEKLNIERARADDEFLRQVLDQTDMCIHSSQGMRSALADADDSFVRDEFDEQPAVPAPQGWHVTHYDGLDIDDLHLPAS